MDLQTRIALEEDLKAIRSREEEARRWELQMESLREASREHEARLRAELEAALSEVREAGIACSEHHAITGRSHAALTSALVAAQARLEAAQKELRRWGY